jgi:hypothetical protein
MGRKLGQILLVNFSLIFGSVIGIKAADLLFWNEDIKFRAWENTERDFWAKNGSFPKNIEPCISFESVITPGTIFKSYVPENTGPVKLEEVLSKYEI